MRFAYRQHGVNAREIGTRRGKDVLYRTALANGLCYYGVLQRTSNPNSFDGLLKEMAISSNFLLAFVVREFENFQ